MPLATRNARTERQLTNDTDLGIAVLIAETEDGQYEVVSPVATLGEANEIAKSDLDNRMRKLERGGDAGICPSVYKLWSRTATGQFRVIAEIES